MLEAIADDIWTIAAEFKVFGLLQLNGRATVIRLSDGSLWVHSPTSLTDELKAQLDALGPVRHLVAPSLFHHLYVGVWREALGVGFRSELPLSQVEDKGVGCRV